MVKLLLIGEKWILVDHRGSVVGPFLFLVYINDITDGITSICKIVADDTSLLSKVIDTRNFQSALNSDLESNLEFWLKFWQLGLPMETAI